MHLVSNCKVKMAVHGSNLAYYVFVLLTPFLNSALFKYAIQEAVESPLFFSKQRTRFGYQEKEVHVDTYESSLY